MDRIRLCDLAPTNGNHFTALGAAFERVFHGGQFIGGHELEAFEAEFADYVGARHCVGVSSGFAALSLIMRAIDANTVAIPANTCRPTFAAAVDAGFDIYSIQVVEPTNFPNLDGADVETIDADALIRVFLHGYACDCQPARARFYIDDACQAVSREYKSSKRSNFSHAAAWSFYPTKNLGAYGDAGAVTTNIDSIAEVIREQRDYRGKSGINARLDNLQAAFLRVNMQFLDDWHQTRVDQAAYYNRRLRWLRAETTLNAKIILPPSSPLMPTNWHHYVVRLPAQERDSFRYFLSKRQVETAIHYSEPGSSYIGYFPQSTLDECASKVSLPIGPHLSVGDIERVIDAICDYYRSKNE
jgi:dTDP-4-amino-4,6-dideoxygalactose transaminase